MKCRVEGAPASVAKRIPVEGQYRDGDDPFGPVVSLLLHFVGGRLHELEVLKDGGSPIRVGPIEVALDRIAV